MRATFISAADAIRLGHAQRGPIDTVRRSHTLGSRRGGQGIAKITVLTKLHRSNRILHDDEIDGR